MSQDQLDWLRCMIDDAPSTKEEEKTLRQFWMHIASKSAGIDYKSEVLKRHPGAYETQDDQLVLIRPSPFECVTSHFGQCRSPFMCAMRVLGRGRNADEAWRNAYILT